MTKRNITSPLPTNLRTAIEAQQPRLTQEALARQIDVSLRTVQGWLRGESLPRWPQLCALAVALDRDPDWFYRDHSETKAAA